MPAVRSYELVAARAVTVWRTRDSLESLSQRHVRLLARLRADRHVSGCMRTCLLFPIPWSLVSVQPVYTRISDI
eukprot:6173450-Pleurochrysis_carterae.AAC.1